jgi:hypothetical protein
MQQTARQIAEITVRRGMRKPFLSDHAASLGAASSPFAMADRTFIAIKPDGILSPTSSAFCLSFQSFVLPKTGRSHSCPNISYIVGVQRGLVSGADVLRKYRDSA